MILRKEACDWCGGKRLTWLQLTETVPGIMNEDYILNLELCTKCKKKIYRFINRENGIERK